MSHLSTSGLSLSGAALAAAGRVSKGVLGLDQETAGGLLRRRKQKTERRSKTQVPTDSKGVSTIRLNH